MRNTARSFGETSMIPEVNSVWICNATDLPVYVVSLHHVLNYDYAIVAGIKFSEDKYKFAELKVVCKDLEKLYKEHARPSQREIGVPCDLNDTWLDIADNKWVIIETWPDLCCAQARNSFGKTRIFFDTDFSKMTKYRERSIFERLLED